MTRHPNIRTSFLSTDEAKRLYELYPHLKSDPDLYCPTCQKTGSYFWKGENIKCDCELQLQLHKHYLASGIGVTYQRLDWDDYSGGDPLVTKQLYQYLSQHQQFVSRGVGLFFLGEQKGTGKTMASTLLMKDLIKLGYNCFATTFASMIEMYTAGWSSPAERNYFQKKIKYSDVLLLDDLGRELRSKNKLSEATFDDVLRGRVQGGRPTYITTNITLQELSEGYGSAALSLLKESSIVHEFHGEDFRGESNQRLLKELQAGIVRPIQ